MMETAAACSGYTILTTTTMVETAGEPAEAIQYYA
jgi:hypothetical protein